MYVKQLKNGDVTLSCNAKEAFTLRAALLNFTGTPVILEELEQERAQEMYEQIEFSISN